jgi:hypothetical protein
MPLTSFQAQIFKTIAANRNPDSFAAGGVVINRHENSSRFSDDIDIFHHTAQAVSTSADADAETLTNAGYGFEFLRREKTFQQAIVRRGDDYVRIDWAADSAYRFFPIVKDEVLGYRLHDADAATNKVLAAVGRQKVRDFIDLMQLDRDYISLGLAVWAAVDKDEGYTPPLVMEFLRRNSLINPATLEDVTFVKPETPLTLKKRWLERLEAAKQLISSLPQQPLGCLYLDRNGQPARGDVFDPSWTPHFGSVGGAWPKIVTD